MRFLLAAAAVATAAVVTAGAQQQTAFERLPATVLDAMSPDDRVAGPPGRMAIENRACRSFPAADVRRRIIELAVQEWGYFGFAVVDRTADDDDGGPGERSSRSRRRRGSNTDATRVASSIAGYWAVTSDGGWILENQNAIWNRSDSTSRWRHAWSAAFISWLMCEGGLASSTQFQRAIAHHTYIDQAIRARDGRAASAAFTAYQPGETPVTPGDLVCSARRPAYTSLAERRRQMGEGARTHCDVVVKVDDARGRILTIGGNVRGTVGLKAFPADLPGIFAHLRLSDAYAAADVFEASPAVQALGCQGGILTPGWQTAASLIAPDGLRCTQ